MALGRIPSRLRSLSSRLSGVAAPTPRPGRWRWLVNDCEDPGRLPQYLPAMEFLPFDPPDEAVCGRLVAAFHRADRGGVAGGVWHELENTCHRDLLGHLRGRDVAAVACLLGRMFTAPLTHGLALGRDMYDAARRDPEGEALLWHDWAIALGVGRGVLPLASPEQGEYGQALFRDSPAVVGQVCAAAGVSPAPPQVGGLFGVRVAGGVVPVNYLLHLYTAGRLPVLAPGGPWDCLEIGGGVGFLAFAAAQAGVRRYCIIDLPLVNVLQGYVLLKSPVGGRVRLFGEAPPPDGPAIDIRPDWSLDALEPKSFDLVVNQDSLPEMAPDTMTNYLRAVPRLARRAFLSINQEAQAGGGPSAGRQGWVHEVCRRMDGLRLEYRAPYWVRKGYVEELYRVVGDAAPH